MIGLQDWQLKSFLSVTSTKPVSVDEDESSRKALQSAMIALSQGSWSLEIAENSTNMDNERSEQ